MKIAVLGWGSLVWDKRELKIAGRWKPDGPLLPVEFARISSNGRLTLVLRQGSRRIRTLWARMKEDDLGRAMEQLSEREGTSLENIGFLETGKADKATELPMNLNAHLVSWVRKKGFDAVIWTDLPENFEEKRKKPFTIPNVLSYLESLKGEQRREAKKYIRNAPRQTNTKIRRAIEKSLGWTPSSKAMALS